MMIAVAATVTVIVMLLVSLRIMMTMMMMTITHLVCSRWQGEGEDGDEDDGGDVDDADDEWDVNEVDGDDHEDDGHDGDDGDDHNVDNDHSACVQQVNGVKERMTRRKFRDFLHDQIGISSQVIADRIFVYFNKVFSNQIYFWESVVDSVVT